MKSKTKIKKPREKQETPISSVVVPVADKAQAPEWPVESADLDWRDKKGKE